MQRTRFFIVLIGLIIGWLLLNRLGEAKASGWELNWALAIYIICSLPLLIYLLRQEKNIPYLPAFGMFYFIYFGLPVLNGYNLFLLEGLSPLMIIRCLDLVFWSFLSLLIAFYSPLGFFVNLFKTKISLSWDLTKAYRLGISLGLIGLGVQYFNLKQYVPVDFTGVIAFISTLSRLGITVLFILQLQHKLKLRGRVILWLGLFLPKLGLDLITGANFEIISDFMIIFFLYFYFRRSIPWVRGAIFVVIFFVIFSGRERYRELTWFQGPYANAQPIKKVAVYIQAISERFSASRTEYRQVYDSLSARTNSLVAFVKIIHLTPGYVPYWGGYTYRSLFSTLVPRFLMPAKPKMMLGQEYGHRYMFLHPTDIITSLNLHTLIEMYINFGPPGMLIGMFMLGLIFRLFYSLFNHPATGEGGLLISNMIFIQLLAIESDFSLVFGNIIQYTILFYLITKFMRPAVRRKYA